MAINQKIVKKIKEKTTEDPIKKRMILNFLTRVEEGRQPKREIDKIMNELKTSK